MKPTHHIMTKADNAITKEHHVTKQSTQNHIKSKQHTACAGVHI